MKSKYFLRYRYIIEILQRNSLASFEKIHDYLIYKFKILGYQMQYSPRTFQRDKNDISEIFDIQIEYDRSTDNYFINEDNISETAKILLDAFILSNVLHIHNNYKKHISFEKSNFGNSGIFFMLSDAIKNRNRIKLHYQKYYSDTHNEYLLEPLALKEFRQRWYLIASNINGNRVRTFGLDRMLNIEILKNKYINNNFDIETFFYNYYGVITDEDSEFTEVILSFDSYQGNYVKSLPLHKSQEVIKDNEDELVIKLKLHITFDFIQKLLSYGKFLKVISPKSLKNIIKKELKEALDNY